MNYSNLPRITIVTTCFNREKYIRQTIESVLEQNYPNLEYIVIDDGSTDGSWEIIQEYADKLHYSEQLSGYRKTPIHAINYGLEKGTGEICGWLNDKNTLLSRSLFVLAEVFMQHSDVKWITGLASTIDEDGRIVSVRSFRKSKYDFMISKWPIIQQESTFWTRELWKRAGGLHESDGWGFDTGLWTRFFESGETLYHLRAPLGTYRKMPSGRSIAHHDDYVAASDSVVSRLYERATIQERFFVWIYYFLNATQFLWRNIPNRYFFKLPFVHIYGHPCLEYKFAHRQWIQSIKNPFRQDF